MDELFPPPAIGPIAGTQFAAAGDKLIWWWRSLLLLVLSCSLGSIFFFTARNPLCTVWDENEYLNDGLRDMIHFSSGGWAGLWHSWLNTGAFRPPAHRLVLLPLTVTHAVSLAHLRIAGVLLLIASICMLYLAVRTISARPAGLLCAAIFGSSLSVVTSCRSYGTEPIHYLAVAASMYFLFRAVVGPRPRSWVWIGLGAAMGVGLLAKLSFPWVIGPMYGYALILAFLKRCRGANATGLIGAAVIAAAVASPWYWTDLRKYLYLARISQHWDRISTGKLTPQVARNWMVGIWSEGFGQPLAILILGLLILSMAAWVIRRSRTKSPAALNPALPVLSMCVLGALPFPIGQLFFSENHAVRLLTPAFLPALAAVMISVGLTPLLNSRIVLCAAAAMFAWQIQSLIIPRNAYVYDLWDMEPLYGYATGHHLENPRIGFVGYHWNFDREALATPFLERGRINDVFRIWDYTQPWDLKTIRWYAQSEDMIVVAPDYKGLEMALDKGDLDNTHNAEFDQLIRDGGWFSAPVSFDVGRRHVTIKLYFNLKSIAASASDHTLGGKTP